MLTDLPKDRLSLQDSGLIISRSLLIDYWGELPTVLDDQLVGKEAFLLLLIAISHNYYCWLQQRCPIVLKLSLHESLRQSLVVLNLESMLFCFEIEQIEKMDYMGNLTSMFLARTETQYNELNDSINRLIENLGQKMQKELVVIEERILLKYKENLQEAQQNYRDLQEKRNDQTIKENILNLKSEKERVYHQSSEKSLEMNKIYDRLKGDLKKNINYEHQLALQIRFLNKQCAVAKKKSEMLDEQIKEYEQRRAKHLSFKSSERSLNHSQIRKDPVKIESHIVQLDSVLQRRVRNKIENLKEYLEYITSDENTLQKIFSRYDLDSYKTERQKASLIQTVFQDKQFKKFLFDMLFRELDCDS